MLRNQYLQVKEFHTVFGHPVNSKLQTELFNIDKKLVLFRFGLVQEEINELKQAYTENNLVEVVDALADILYVIYGAALVFGIEFTFDVNICQTHTNTNILKDKKTELEKMLYNDGDSIQQLLYNLELSNIDITLFEIILSNLITKVYSVSMCIGVNIDECFNKVHESNMTKVCLNEDDAKDTVEWYKQNEKRYTDPSYRKTDKYYVIFDKATFKILKSRKYKPVELAALLFI